MATVELEGPFGRAGMVIRVGIAAVVEHVVGEGLQRCGGQHLGQFGQVGATGHATQALEHDMPDKYEAIERQHKMRVSFHSNGEVEPVDPLTALSLYRIAQEALQNATTHGRATTPTFPWCATAT